MSKRKSDASDKIALYRSKLLKYQQAMEEATATDEEDGGVNDEMARGKKKKKKRERLRSRSFLPLIRFPFGRSLCPWHLRSHLFSWLSQE